MPHKSLISVASQKGDDNLRPTSILRSMGSIRRSSIRSSTSSNSSKASRHTHFDAANIENTYKPKYKDYGYIKITQAATPFPHRTLGIDANLLTSNRSKSFHEELRKSIDSAMPRPFSSEYLKDTMKMDFLKKRKKFCEGEFTITRQRKPMLVHPPLKSLGDVAHIRFPSSFQNLTKFFRTHYRQRHSTEYEAD